MFVERIAHMRLDGAESVLCVSVVAVRLRRRIVHWCPIKHFENVEVALIDVLVALIDVLVCIERFLSSHSPRWKNPRIIPCTEADSRISKEEISLSPLNRKPLVIKIVKSLRCRSATVTTRPAIQLLTTNTDRPIAVSFFFRLINRYVTMARYLNNSNDTL